MHSSWIQTVMPPGWHQHAITSDREVWTNMWVATEPEEQTFFGGMLPQVKNKRQISSPEKCGEFECGE